MMFQEWSEAALLCACRTGGIASPRPTVQVKLGDRPSTTVGANGLLDCSVDSRLDGQVLTDEEQKQLLAASDGLHARGKWARSQSRSVG